MSLAIVAAGGAVPVGPTERTKKAPEGKMMVLPLRMAEADVDILDAAWERLGFKNRTAFLREAMSALLEARGEVGVIGEVSPLGDAAVEHVRVTLVV